MGCFRDLALEPVVDHVRVMPRDAGMERVVGQREDDREEAREGHDVPPAPRDRPYMSIYDNIHCIEFPPPLYTSVSERCE